MKMTGFSFGLINLIKDKKMTEREKRIRDMMQSYGTKGNREQPIGIIKGSAPNAGFPVDITKVIPNPEKRLAPVFVQQLNEYDKLAKEYDKLLNGKKTMPAIDRKTNKNNFNLDTKTIILIFLAIAGIYFLTE